MRFDVLRRNGVTTKPVPEDRKCRAQRRNTINQYLPAGLVDELRLNIAPLTLGAGTRLFDGVPSLKFEQVESHVDGRSRHVIYRMRS